jgi:hypothetical protein
MVALTWITPGCMQFLKNKKRFYTAWTRNGPANVVAPILELRLLETGKLNTTGT